MPQFTRPASSRTGHRRSILYVNEQHAVQSRIAAGAKHGIAASSASIHLYRPSTSTNTIGYNGDLDDLGQSRHCNSTRRSDGQRRAHFAACRLRSQSLFELCRKYPE